MGISASDVKQLRGQTGAGILDCRKALVESDGDFDKAVDWLRAKGIAKAAKKAGRIATEGQVYSYIHAGGRIGVLLEVNCETDFVARGDEFKAFVHDVALHIAATQPLWVREEDADQATLEREKAVAKQQAIEEGKPEAIAEKMVVGKVKKFLTANTLLLQPFVKDDKMTIADVQSAFVQFCGENVQIRRFVRWNLGEGLEKKVDNFAEEVKSMTAS